MSKAEVHYRLSAPPDDKLLDAIDRAHGIYGLLAVKLTPSQDAVTVQYDASRLLPADVDAALLGSGLPVSRV